MFWIPGRVFLLALCIAAAAKAAEAQRSEIVIGASLPLTGGEAKAGPRVRDGYALAFAEVMRKGGLQVGSRRLPVRLKIVDDGTDRQRAADLAVELVEKDGVDFLLGSFSTPIIESQSAAAEKLKVPYVTSSGSASSLYQRGFRYLFSLSAPTQQLAAALMRWLDEEQHSGALPKPLRVAVAWENTAHGKDVRLGITEYVNVPAAHPDPGGEGRCAARRRAPAGVHRHAEAVPGDGHVPQSDLLRRARFGEGCPRGAAPRRDRLRGLGGLVGVGNG